MSDGNLVSAAADTAAHLFRKAKEVEVDHVEAVEGRGMRSGRR
jgi:hypothetical protein